MPETGSETGTTLVGWLVEPGQPVEIDEPICLVSWNETTAEVGSPATGVLRMLSVGAGVTVPTGTSLALIDTQVATQGEDQLEEPEAEAEPEPQPMPEPEDEPPNRDDGEFLRHIRKNSPEAADGESADASAEAVDAPLAPSPRPQPVPQQLLRDAPVEGPAQSDLASFYSPAVRRLAAELAIDLDDIAGTGLSGRVTLGDVRAHAPTPANAG
jgi:pyruvate dehydrogenase E2 component (dihydrolipoamide acetyltransferase)